MRIQATTILALASFALAGCNDGATHSATPPPPKPTPPHWVYEDVKDTMRDGTAHLACLDSENEVQLTPPYKNQRLKLCVVHDAERDIRVTLRLPLGGQFVCDPPGCLTNAKYGSEPMTKWDGSHPQDGAENVLIFIGGSTITYNLIKPVALQVEPTFYRDGAQIVRFPPVALDRARMALPETEVEALVDHFAPRDPK
jgi:hypothetical protein